MGIDLFQIVGTDDIYFTLGMWAVLSPGLLKRESTKILSISEEEPVEQAEPAPAIPVKAEDAHRV